MFASKYLIHPPPPFERAFVAACNSATVCDICISDDNVCASGFSDPCICCHDHVLLPAICASGIIIFLPFFFLVTFLLWKEDFAVKMFLTTGMKHLFRLFS